MLDMNRIRKEPREVERLLANKGCIVNFDETLALDAKKRALATEGDALKAKRNQLSAQDFLRNVGVNLRKIGGQHLKKRLLHGIVVRDNGHNTSSWVGRVRKRVPSRMNVWTSIS